MRTEVITACTIDGVVERILEELKEDIGGTSSGRRHNVIYFDGWDGLGASAVLREVGRRLAPATSGDKKPAPAAGLEFSHIIHIDCSKWESRRAMQRSLAEKLQLPPPVMNMFDAQDEEDDYNGVDKGSRAEIPQVADAIYRHIQKQLSSRFLVIFNNGSCKEIDLESFGFPLSGYSRNKALWSFQGGFRLYPRTAVNNALESMKMTDVFLSAASDPDPAASGFNLSSILYHEAAEIARKINIGGINWPAAATDCFLYMVKLCRMGSHLMDYDLVTHSCNYWKCDDIIQLQHGTDDDDRVWLSYDALQHEMRLDVGYYQSPSLPSPVSRLPEQISYWTSPTCGFMLIPDQNGRIPKGMFQQYDTLRVLKLSACTFSFTWPPFLCCHSLRFLWLDHCREESSSTDGDGVAGNEDIRRCFQGLWVLDVRYSSSKLLSKKMMDFMAQQLRELHVMGQQFDMGVLQGRLQNIRKLRVTKSHATASYYTDMGGLFLGKDKMELLDFSANSGDMTSFPAVSSSNSLETVIINGSTSLKEISLKGCATLKKLLLSGLFQQLYSLDITGTAVKTLDLGAVEAPMLDQLFLLGCGELYAIIWPPEGKRKRYMGKLRMDTTQKEGANTTSTARAAMSGRGLSRPVEFDWYISARDARILWSLAPVKDYFGPYDAHVVISTTPSPTRSLQIPSNPIYADAAVSMHKEANRGDGDAWAIMCTCPPPPVRSFASTSQDCYMHIEDDMTTPTVQTATHHITVPGFICDGAKTLQVQDSLSITSITAAPLGSSWNKLEWCRAERCPKLQCIFSAQLGAVHEGSSSSSRIDIFKKLKIIWASHLRNARYVLDLEYIGSKGPSWHAAFADLTLLHLYCCPRLVNGVPLQVNARALRSLDTIEVMWCGDLTTVFHVHGASDHGTSHVVGWGLPMLKHVHLHELPRLRGIFGVCGERMHAPRFETIKIRGCWSLFTLPRAICQEQFKVWKCDCEQEWWDRLEGRDPRLLIASDYKLTHPQYHKKPTMLRGSVLR